MPFRKIRSIHVDQITRVIIMHKLELALLTESTCFFIHFDKCITALVIVLSQNIDFGSSGLLNAKYVLVVIPENFAKQFSICRRMTDDLCLSKSHKNTLGSSYINNLL